MNAFNTYITATRARNNFFDLLARVKKEPYPINITVKGIPEAVVMSKEDYDAWVATYETFSDPELMETIKESDKNFAEGKYQTWEEVKKELGLSNNLISNRGKNRYVSRSSRKSRQKRVKKTA